MLGGDAKKDDKLRICPACRTPISVGAYKCKYCGETVGRPKEEARELSIHDLGGETKSTHIASGNVMEALESFRTEEISATETKKEQAKKKSSFFGKKEPPPIEIKRNDDLPELDAYHKDLAASILESSPSSAKSKTKQYGRSSPLRLVGQVLVTLAVIFGAVKGYSAYKEYKARQVESNAPVYRVIAPGLLSRGQSLDRVLEAAVTDVFRKDTPETRKFLEEVRSQIIEKVDRLLNYPRFRYENLSKAVLLANASFIIDSSDKIAALRQAARNEKRAYDLILKSVDGNTAVFVVTDANGKFSEVTVTKGDLFGDGNRFKVWNISRKKVTLRDTMRTNSGLGRQVKYSIGGSRPQ